MIEIYPVLPGGAHQSLEAPVVFQWGRSLSALIAGSEGPFAISGRAGTASPLGIAVIEDRNGDPLMTTYLPRSTLLSNSFFTILKDSIE